jgi:lipopolysaccharide/colanic/teichoic acid biosynthesis glycosyltransferase
MALETLAQERIGKIIEKKEPINGKITLRDITWKDMKEYFAFAKKHGLFYSWKAPGKNNEMNTFYKFQTMVPSSEYHEDNLSPDNFDANGKLKSNKGNGHDILKFAKWMRQTHIDELPQLYNVFVKRNMRLVGIRPMPLKQIKSFFLEDAEKFMESHFKYKPGLNGINHSKGNELKEKLFKYLKQKEIYSIKTDLKYFLNIWCNFFNFKKSA